MRKNGNSLCDSFSCDDERVAWLVGGGMLTVWVGHVSVELLYLAMTACLLLDTGGLGRRLGQ